MLVYEYSKTFPRVSDGGGFWRGGGRGPECPGSGESATGGTAARGGSVCTRGDAAPGSTGCTGHGAAAGDHAATGGSRS